MAHLGEKKRFQQRNLLNYHCIIKDMWIIGALSNVGAAVQRMYFSQLIVLSVSLFLSGFKKVGNRKDSFKTYITQTYLTGVEAVPQIAILAAIVGAITILQAVTVMPKLGGGDALGGVMVAVVIRELGPLMTALFIAGRSGSALSTYIGSMKMMQEVDALKAMGVDPLHYLIMPVFFATLTSMFCLTMLFNLVAILGGYLIVWITNIVIPGIFTAHLSLPIFTEKIFDSIGLLDIGYAVVKPLIFGMFISVIACFHGMSVGLDVRQVPKATRVTVVHSFILIIVIDLLLSIPFFLQLKEKMVL
jgi:phospholipid/cholesterol/gamma-HCH transport system permease protein